MVRGSPAYRHGMGAWGRSRETRAGEKMLEGLGRFFRGSFARRPRRLRPTCASRVLLQITNHKLVPAGVMQPGCHSLQVSAISRGDGSERMEPSQGQPGLAGEIQEVRRESRIRRDSLPKHRRPFHGLAPRLARGGQGRRGSEGPRDDFALQAGCPQHRQHVVGGGHLKWQGIMTGWNGTGPWCRTFLRAGVCGYRWLFGWRDAVPLRE